MMNAITQFDARDWHALPPDGTDYVKKLGKGVKGLKIAYSPTLGYVDVDPEIAACVDKAVSVLEVLAPRSSGSIRVSRIQVRRFSAPCGGRGRGCCSTNCRRPSARCSIRGSMTWSSSRNAMTIDDYLEAQRLRGLLGFANAPVHGEV